MNKNLHVSGKTSRRNFLKAAAAAAVCGPHVLRSTVLAAPGKPEMRIPEGLDWDMWCNQTELRPYHTELHRARAKWWAYDGGGQINGMTGWGTHAIDQIQCALGTGLFLT